MHPLFSSYCSGPHRDLHSFPTRRSSDLEPGGGGYVAQRILSTKNERHALLAALWFNIAHYALRPWPWIVVRSEEHTSELQSHSDLVCRLLLEKKKKIKIVKSI